MSDQERHHTITFGLEYLIRRKWCRTFTFHQMSVLFGLQYSDSLTTLLLYQNVDTIYLERFGKYETWGC